MLFSSEIENDIMTRDDLDKRLGQLAGNKEVRYKMKKKNNKNLKKRLVLVGGIILTIFVVLFAAFYIYTLDYYRASDDVQVMIDESGLKIESLDGFDVIYPEETKDQGIGIVFYPGGKVEAKAYMPLLLQLTDKGYTCALVEMPFNLAVFNVKGADRVLQEVKEVDKWYLAGHSLGGAMASSYIEGREDLFEGLILLGAYPTNDADINTLAIYGTYDIKLDLEKVEKANQVYEIIGGNHAQFGNYGKQEGDGEAKISRETQQKEAVEVIVNFIEG